MTLRAFCGVVWNGVESSGELTDKLGRQLYNVDHNRDKTRVEGKDDRERGTFRVISEG